MIPILDLTEEYLTLQREIDDAVRQVLAGGQFIQGPNVRAFEDEIAGYVGAGHAVAVNSGTDALHLALRALDVGPGDEIITTPFTFIATSEAIAMVGATPVFVDIDPLTFNIDPTQIERAISPKTRVILPVHLYGSPAPMTEIVRIARHHSLAVVEDCAQAIGAEVDGRKVGSFGEVGCFSFYPTKNLGAYGDGGMITTNSPTLAARIGSLRVHGSRVKYVHDELGVNSRLDELQAAILRVKLPHLEARTRARRGLAARYGEALDTVAGIVVPVEAPGSRRVYHQYTIRIADRDAVQRQMTAAGIQTVVYYPVPLHLQTVHANLGLGAGSFPHAETAAREVLSLPIYPELSEAKQAAVIDQLRKAVRRTVVA